MKKISLTIASRSYDISFDSSYKLEEELAKDNISLHKSNDIKALLHAYLSKTYENLTMKDELEKMLEKLENI